MDCQECRRLLPGLLFQEAGELEKRALEEHLEQCPQCRQEFQDLKKIVDAVKNLPDPDAPRLLYSALAARAKENREEKFTSQVRKLFLKTTAAAALAAAVFLSILVIGKDYLPWPLGNTETLSFPGKGDEIIASVPRTSAGARNKLVDKEEPGEELPEGEIEAPARPGIPVRELAAPPPDSQKSKPGSPTRKKGASLRPTSTRPDQGELKSLERNVQPVAEPPEKDGEVETLLARAEEKEKSGDFQAALALYREIIARLAPRLEPELFPEQKRKTAAVETEAQGRSEAIESALKEPSPARKQCAPELSSALAGAVRCLKNLDRKDQAKRLSEQAEKICPR